MARELGEEACGAAVEDSLVNVGETLPEELQARGLIDSSRLRTQDAVFECVADANTLDDKIYTYLI